VAVCLTTEESIHGQNYEAIGTNGIIIQGLNVNVIMDDAINLCFAT